MHILARRAVSSRGKVQNTHMSANIRALHGAILDIMAVMNRPQRDDLLLSEAGISLDRALFPLLVRIERAGPIGIVELAERIGRDYTTVSRQVAKLEELGLAERLDNPTDRRVRRVAVSIKGKAMTDALDAARDRLFALGFSSWEPGEVDALVRLTRKFADMLTAKPPDRREPGGDR
jgi:DNA-binding MarR family transcriptional regulator